MSKKSHVQEAIKNLEEKYPKIDWQGLEETVRWTIRNLDNVIDVNFYNTSEAKNANQKHRPIGMGVMGWQDMVHQLGLNMESEEAVELSDRLFEFLSYVSLDESVDLAQEKGSYETFQGSKWEKGILPVESMQEYLQKTRKTVNNDFTKHLDWETLRQRIQSEGLRNSQVMAVAPTRSISYVAGTSPSIEPWDSNTFTEVGMTGKYQVINHNLIDELQEKGLWTWSVIQQIKDNEGSLKEVEEIPKEIRDRYKTAWEIHPKWVIAQNARRQKWVDMGISFNMWLPNNNGKDAERAYTEAWKAGLKTTYYLHSRSKTQSEKLGLEKSQQEGGQSSQTSEKEFSGTPDLTDPECEVCQ